MNVNEDIESIGLTKRGTMDLTKDLGQWRSFIHQFVPIAAKWLASRTDDDDYDGGDDDHNDV